MSIITIATTTSMTTEATTGIPVNVWLLCLCSDLSISEPDSNPVILIPKMFALNQNRVAVKELNLTYDIGETLSIIICTIYGNLIYAA